MEKAWIGAFESTEHKRKNTRVVAFLSKIYEAVSEFWPETEIPLKVTELNQLITLITPW